MTDKARELIELLDGAIAEMKILNDLLDQMSRTMEEQQRKAGFRIAEKMHGIGGKDE